MRVASSARRFIGGQELIIRLDMRRRRISPEDLKAFSSEVKSHGRANLGFFIPLNGTLRDRGDLGLQNIHVIDRERLEDLAMRFLVKVGVERAIEEVRRKTSTDITPPSPQLACIHGRLYWSIRGPQCRGKPYFVDAEA